MNSDGGGTADTTWLGAFGEGWFYSLCVTAGCAAAMPHPDKTGVDFHVDNRESETIRVQVKSTENPERQGNDFVFDLDVATYDRLRQGSAPGFLVLVVVHQPPPHRSTYLRSATLTQATGYWCSLHGLPPTKNTSTVRLSLVAGKMLDPNQLRALFPETLKEAV